MKTIAQQLNIKKFPFEIKDKNGNVIYRENSDGFWSKQEFDERNNKVYYETSNGFWVKREFDERDNEVYYETSIGVIEDNRPKSVPEYTMEELTAKLGHEFKIKKQ